MTSKIKVDNINKVSDDSNIIKKCGTTTTIGSGASNPIVVDGSAITLGRCGGTVSIASGATTSGMGRTGTVDWQTGSIKTSTFTAANGEGYFCNTAGGTFEVDLPAGSAGAIVSIQDYNNTFDSNELTVDPNGSEKINGGVAGDPVTLTTEGQGVTFVYIDATVGWRSVQDNQFSQSGSAPTFICASVSGTGNTLATAPDCANTKIATFTGPGNFTVSSISNCAPNNIVSYMVVAGGGGGGYEDAGGGGAGGFREVKSPATPYTASPLDGFSTPANRITVTATTFPIVVGAGGTGGVAPAADPTGRGANGSVSTFSTISSAGGGGGGGAECNSNAGWRLGQAGGSGGGGAGVYSPQPQDGSCGPAGGAGNTPPVSPSQGNTGGNGPTLNRQNNNVAELGGGGGGATQAGQKTPSPTTCGAGGAGGTGATTSISATPTGYAGGGGGGIHTYGGGAGSRSAGGTPTAGQGGTPGPNANKSGTSASANSGGGGGGSGGNGAAASTGGAGGSGIVIIRYKFQ